MKKVKSNRQVLTKAIKELSDIDLVFFRERILYICENVLNNKDEVRKNMKDGFISPELYIECIENIKHKVEFE